ncbi:MULTISPECIES: lipid A biosynthesis acyltransferase [unclassified Acinetobacter]|uniref:lysophospholipid acyltransferase family protein n=1 Tax=unclassified Acinetobacter TaxID=196816 RepID=UPI002934167F|nr:MULTISPECIES: lipid A biosynthesis acyltransferase [unclassified Acinetobacter]WOE31566.1 lipid A biosynthesis acyltransferase [Acinetobacter sp. SAAs470]WOE39763.1 lipid A biosynthesis acyltransferase [Acinetobacter sp. SAAs474]
MSNQKSKSTILYLLNFFSRRSLTASRIFSRCLSFLINTLHLTKTSKIIDLNLKIALPELDDANRELITRRAIQNEMMSYMEFFHIWGSQTKQNIQRVHKIHQEYLLHEALAQQKGVVLVVPHFGTWEIMNTWVAQYTQMTIMYKPIKNPIADEFVRAARSRERAHLVPTDESGVRQIFKALKKGGTTVILPDHTPHHGADMIPYFDLPLFSSNLSAKLIQKTQAKGLFLYALRNENEGFDMYIEEIDPMIYEVSADEGTHLIFKAQENLIRQRPEHYHWSYKRFSANPSLKRIYDIAPTEALAQITQVRNDYLTHQTTINQIEV